MTGWCQVTGWLPYGTTKSSQRGTWLGPVPTSWTTYTQSLKSGRPGSAISQHGAFSQIYPATSYQLREVEDWKGGRGSREKHPSACEGGAYEAEVEA